MRAVVHSPVFFVGRNEEVAVGGGRVRFVIVLEDNVLVKEIGVGGASRPIICGAAAREQPELVFVDVVLGVASQERGGHVGLWRHGHCCAVIGRFVPAVLSADSLMR